MMNNDEDPHSLHQKAQALLHAALRNHLPSAEPKRAAVSSSSFPGNQSFHGFTRIPLSLTRTFSTPVSSQDINCLNHVQPSNFQAPASSSVITRLPEESSGVNSAPDHSLYRSSSAPVPESHLPMPAPVPGKSAMLPPAPIPDAKRTKRIKERVIQMKKLWDECIMEEEEEDAASQNAHHCPHKDDHEASNATGIEKQCEEPVWVEMRGEIRVLHLKCHCNKAYQILLSGNDCYYKL